MSRSDFVFDPQVGFEEFVRKAYGDEAKARKVGDCYTKHGLNSAVRKACEKAAKKKTISGSWSPGQLRKTRATQARQQGDLETAQQVLGHSSKQTTERHYAYFDGRKKQSRKLLWRVFSILSGDDFRESTLWIHGTFWSSVFTISAIEIMTLQ
jgi:integrase